MDTKYIYCFIRKDLPLVQQIIQLGHSCWEMSSFQDPFETVIRVPNMVLFEVSGERELKDASSYLSHKNIMHVTFQEPDIDDQYTSICTEVIETEQKRAFFRNFKLYS